MLSQALPSAADPPMQSQCFLWLSFLCYGLTFFGAYELPTVERSVEEEEIVLAADNDNYVGTTAMCICRPRRFIIFHA